MSNLAAGDEVYQTTDYAARQWSNDLTEQGGTTPNNPERMFDGSLDTFLQSSNYNATVMWDISAYPLTGKLKVYVGIVANGNSYPIIYKDKNNNNTNKTFYNVTEFFELDVEELIYFQVRLEGFQNYTQIKGVKLDDEFIINNQPIALPTPGTTGTVESINGTSVQLTEKVDGWVVGDDVIGPDKTPFRSMTEEELAEQKLKFLTYQNRKAVAEGEQAMKLSGRPWPKSFRRGALMPQSCSEPRPSVAAARRRTKRRLACGRPCRCRRCDRLHHWAASCRSPWRRFHRSGRCCIPCGLHTSPSCRSVSTNGR